MQLQVLKHRNEFDSVDGYVAPPDISDLILAYSLQSIDEMNGILKSNGFKDCPYTILYGGHQITDLEKDEDPCIRPRTLLAVPKDPVVKVILPNSVWVSSVGTYQATIMDLKGALQNRFENNPRDILFIDMMGKILDDKSSLISAQVFEDMNPLLCRPQLDEYQLADSASDRMSAALSSARLLQQEWCAFGDVQNEIEEALRSTPLPLGEIPLVPENEANLKTFSYDCFKQDFPSEIAPPLADSDDLRNLKAVIARSVGQFSACPALAQNIIDTLSYIIKGTNRELASQTARILGTLVEPLEALAHKRPMQHDHDGYFRKLHAVERSLDMYREIMAGKRLCSPAEMQQRTDTLQSLLEVRSSPKPSVARPGSA